MRISQVCLFVAVCLLSLVFPAGAFGTGEDFTAVPVKVSLVYTDGVALKASISSIDGKKAGLGIAGILQSSNKFPTTTLLNLELDRVYTAIPSASGTFLKFIPMPGYEVLVGGAKGTMAGLGQQVRIVRAGSSDIEKVGDASSLATGRIYWSASLGTLANGESAGRLLISGSGVSNWADYAQPKGLALELPYPDAVQVRKQKNAVLDQVASPQTYVVIEPVDAMQYKIKFYHRDQKPGTYTSLPKKAPVTRLPFVTYYIQNLSTSTEARLKIIREYRSVGSADDTAASIVRTEWTSVERTGTSYENYAWRSVGWTRQGDVELKDQVNEWSTASDGSFVEKITKKRLADDTVEYTSSSTHRSFVWGVAPTRLTVGEVNPEVVDVDYYEDATDLATYGFPRIRRTAGGQWQSFKYIKDNNLLKRGAFGQVDQVFTSYGDTPALPSEVENLCEVTDYTYGKDEFGGYSRIKAMERRVNGVMVENKATQYTQVTIKKPARQYVEAVNQLSPIEGLAVEAVQVPA